MARRQVLVQLNDALLARLDERSGQIGCSRSRAIRSAVERWLELDPETTVDRAIAAGYTRKPPTAHDAAWAEISTVESIAEEPW
jgi:metal-responsive CopG/Arc/MetJ family transcriptional regulator